MTGENRFLVVYKKNVTPCLPTADSNATYLRLTNNTVDKLVELFANDPVSDVEKESTVFRSNEGQSHAHLPFMFGDSRSKARVTVPPKTIANNNYTAARHSLPIFEYRDEILGAINQHQVVVISGETGLYHREIIMTAFDWLPSTGMGILRFLDCVLSLLFWNYFYLSRNFP